MKMKFIGLVGLVLASASYAAPAGKGGGDVSRAYGTAGCGLGSLVIGKGDDFMQVFGVTTNGTFYNQGFGITFGTLNCDSKNIFQKADNMDSFVGANKLALANDIARGNGESIVSLASVLDCSNGVEGELAGELHKSFREIFPSHTVPTMEVTDSILSVVSRHQGLAKACKVVM